MEEVQVSVNEEATDKPKTGEEGAFELPEGDFEDGMLGISVSIKITMMMNVFIMIIMMIVFIMIMMILIS